MSPLALHLLYAALWVSFGLGHSLLADARIKARLKPLFRAGYRLAYNLFAVVHVAIVVAAGFWLFRASLPFALPSELRTGLWIVQGAGWIVLIAALAGYDLGRLAGTAQLRAEARGQFLDDEEPLRRAGLHRYVRHPLYAGGFLILWGRIVDDFTLATAVFASLYLWIGARFEERRLLARFGDLYARYLAAVPAFVPWRGRAWRE